MFMPKKCTQLNLIIRKKFKCDKLNLIVIDFIKIPTSYFLQSTCTAKYVDVLNSSVRYFERTLFLANTSLES